ncbi:HWE histidine kinase domain-containing protein [Beijerinckia sp. L45]|uniref:HWE histidine kinase domain-containing protein n=1 Tax=Beijerinckia sp. L45 TaxID=1641855 RepID=UPI001FF014F6|nr:HWE histidine kinase domain-containing protein [Beijerinckia sp. L45]
MTEAPASLPDMSECDREPVHTPGSIQAHGSLIAFSLPTWAIAHVSKNAPGLFGHATAEGMIGASMETVLSPQIIHDLRNTFQAAMISGFAERMSAIAVGVHDEPHDLMIHASGALAVVEFVPCAGADTMRADPSMLVKAIMDRLRRTTSFQAFLTSAARQIRAITGYDRVMIYRFLDDDSGQVIAEALRFGLAPYMHQHYPASDIPAQARALYKRQWLRLIPAVDYTPVPVIPGIDKDGLPLDLSQASLRSVSPVHLQYLRNMGSAGTLTVSIMHGDRLWGLIACHHETPRRLSATTCAAVELFAMVFSSQIEAKEQQDELSYIAKSRETHDRLIASMEPEETIFDNLRRFGDLLREMIVCDGIGIWTNGCFEGAGIVPPDNGIEELVRLMQTKRPDRVYATTALGDELPDAMRYADQVSGVIAIPFSRSPRDILFLFRREVVQTVLWGGEPTKIVDPATGAIGPRKSFEAWREIVRGKSLPWRSGAIDIAETLRVSLLDVILRRTDLVDRERRIAHESQALLVAELNHRVKNVLAVVGSLIRQSRPGDQTIEAFSENLQSRIQALSIAHDQLTRSHWQAAPLRPLIEAEARAWSDVGCDRLVLSGPPVMVASRAYQTLALVLHEMMTNAAKYGALSVPDGRLAISWSLDDDLTLLWVETNGPRVEAPSRRGFGTVVTEQSIPFELHGTAVLDYLPAGVRACFTIPAEFVDASRLETKAVTAAVALKADLNGKTLLLVEDSMMIALDAQAMLQGCGADVELVSTTREAKRALTLNRFDAAILDVNLYSETSFTIAEDLQDRRIPFVFATGYGEMVSVPERFKDVSIVSKPYAEDSLRGALAV